MKKNIRVIKYNVIVICAIVCILFLIYLFTDQPYPGTPYDTWFVSTGTPLYVEQPKEKNLIAIEEIVGQYARKWVGAEKVVEVDFYINQKHGIEKFLLQYEVNDVEKYPGRLYVDCEYIDDCFVIISAHTLYGEEFNNDVKQLEDLEDVEMIYYKTLDYLEDNNFGECYNFMIYINEKSVYIHVFDEEGKIVEKLKLDIQGNNLIENN